MKKIITFLLVLFTVVAVQAQTLLSEDFENGIPSTWTIIDADGDGNLWISSVDISGALGHNGSDCAYSQSFNDSQGALTPDNWLITPAVTLTENANLTFWVCAQDAAYAAEHYGVYISTTSNTDISTFTLLMEETLDANGGAKTQSTWKKKTIDLSDYTGNTVYIAFRHYNCSDMFYLDLDDVEISAIPTVPTILTSVPTIDFGICSLGNWRKKAVTVTSYNLTTDITVTSTAPFEISTNDISFGTTATIPVSGGTFYVRYTPTTEGAASGTITLSSAGVSDATISLYGHAINCTSTIPYHFNFDDADNALCWEIVDANDDGNTFTINYSNQAAYYNYSPDLNADDWLISPVFSLTGEQFASFDYYAASSSYPEQFQVFAIGTDTIALTPIIDVTNTAPITQNLDISALTGNYKIAFHCISEADMYRFHITNFNITSSASDSVNYVPEFTYEMVNTCNGVLVHFENLSQNAENVVWDFGDGSVSEEHSPIHKYTASRIYTVSLSVYNSSGDTIVGSLEKDVQVLIPASNFVTLPYEEDFESYTTSTVQSTGVEPTCWELVQEDVEMPDAKRPQLYYKSAFAHSGNYSLLFNYRGVYALPMLGEDIYVNSLKMSFYLRQPNSLYRLQVGVVNADGEFELVEEINNASTGVELVTVDFSNYTGQGRRIAFRNTLGGGATYKYSYNYVDDIKLYTDTIVSMVPSNRNVLLEDFTGYEVQYCPEGHRIANEIKAANPDRVCVINIHYGYYAHNTYTTAFGDSLAQQTGLTGYPSATINRHVFTDSVTALNRSFWPQYANQMLNMPSPVNIAAVGTLDMSTRKLTVRVQLYYTGSQSVTSNALNIAVLQDRVLGHQAGMDFNPDQIVGDQYSHMHMLRHLIAGQWGETIYSIAQGSFVERTYEYVIPEQLGSPNPINAMLENLKFVAFVSEGHQEVLTCIEVPVRRLNMPALAGAITRMNEISNLTCSTQTDVDFEFVNQGSTPVTSLNYTYSIGGNTQTVSWNGNVGTFETTIVHIPTFDFEPNTDNTLNVQITKINGTDVNVNPKTLTIHKNVYSGSGAMLLTIVTDRYGDETTFEIFDSDGNVVLSGGPWDDLGSNSTMSHEILFEPQSAGCYRLEVYDAYGDGINSGFGEGYFTMTQMQDGVQLFYNNGNFGTQVTYMIDINSVNDCEPISLPYSENFDGFTESTTTATGVEPTCWELVRTDAPSMPDDKRPQVYYKNTFAHSGGYSLLMNYRCVYAMPALSEGTTLQNVKLDMFLRQANAAYQLEVGVWDDATNTFTRVALFNNTTTGVEHVTCNFSGYSGNGKRIAFRNVLGSGSYAYSYNYLDDITLTEMVDCSITLPYTENFDDFTTSTTTTTGVEPTCWELVRTDAPSMPNDKRPQVYYRSDFAHNSSYSLLLNYRCVYAMPALSEETDIPLNRVKLDMYLRQANAAYQLEVGVWDDATNTFTPVALFNNTTTGVEHVTCNFSGYSGNGKRIAFRNVLGSGSYAYSYNYLDDITLTEIEDCSITLPYTETFENFTTSTTATTGEEPTCWELVRTDAPSMPNDKRPQVYYRSDFAHSGSYSLLMNYRCVYAMPEISGDVPMNNVKLEMYLRQPNTAYQLQVGVWDDATSTFEPVALFKNSTNNVTYVTCDFSDYSGNGRRIAFRNVLKSGFSYAYSYNYLDDITLTRISNNKSAEVTSANTFGADLLDADRDMVDVVVYPNPTKDVVNVQCTMNNAQCSGIEIVDVYGKIITTVGTRFIASAQFPASAPTQINVSGLAAGMYFVRVTTDRGVVTKPFVKQ